MKTTEFVTIFRANKNPKKQVQMEQYLRNQFPFLGLQATERRTLAKDFLNAKTKEAKQEGIDWDLIFFLWDLPEREFQLTALDYLRRTEKLLTREDFPRLQQLLLSKSWWDSVDTLARYFGLLVQKEPDLLEDMKAWSVAENMWMRRIAILHQLRYKESTDTDVLCEIIRQNLDEDNFFIRKAIGWALREYAKTNEQWVRDFVKTYDKLLSPLSIREATKNIALE